MIRTNGRLAAKLAGRDSRLLDKDFIPLNIKAVDMDSTRNTADPERNISEVDYVVGSEDVADVDDSDVDNDLDEAPEEESNPVAKQQFIEKSNQEKIAEQRLRQLEREKRKAKDARLKHQLEIKRERISKLAAAKELPDLLPEEVFEPETLDQKGKHIRLEELEKLAVENSKRAKLEKLRQIKELRKLALRRGPVHVQVQSFGNNRVSVPRAEANVLHTKISWLQRASLGKK